MIDIKSPGEVSIMAEGGKKLGRILDELLQMVKPDVSLVQIEEEASEKISRAGGTPSFQTVEGYQWATCLCVNDTVVHGIPTKQKLKAGDLITIDVGMLYQGFHTDTAWTAVVQSTTPDTEKFLHVGKVALEKAIDQARAGNRVGHISQAIQAIVEGVGYGIVKTLVGHGVGKTLHEEPQIPGILKGTIESTPELVVGMTIAIEIIYAQGKGSVVYANDDGWSIATRDGSKAAVFEHTVAITEKGPVVLTRRSS